MRPRGRDVVCALALLSAGAYGAWVALASRGAFGERWSDGRTVLDGLDDVRFAVWDEPEPLLSAELAGGRSAVSPDGRFLVVAAGERGLGCDLLVCDLVEGRPRDPRPLDALNSAFDDLAPAFGPDALYFATDRAGPEHGLDVWRAPYADGAFGAPEPVPGAVNGPADDTDPLPVPGTGEIVFASSRARGLRADFDLYVASPDQDGRLRVARLAELASPFDEREPGLTADGRTLVFASDRAGSRGGFDLYRSLKESGRWLPPVAIDGLNGPESERAPLASADGFALTFARAGELVRARSRELFRLPPRAPTLADLILLCALLALAALAAFARRGGALEVLYRCLLVSLLAHLLLMWALRHVVPESEPVALGGEERLFRVRLERPGPDGAERERAGALAAERADAAADRAPGRAEVAPALASAEPAARELERGEHVQALPGREGLEIEPAAALDRPLVRLHDQAAPFERKRGDAPALALQAGPSAAAPAPREAAAPERAAAAAAPADDAAPALQALARGERPADAAPVPARRTAAPARRAPSGGVEVALAAPPVASELKDGGAAALALPAVAATAAPRRDAPGPERARTVEPLAVGAQPGLDPLPRAPEALAGAAPREPALPARDALPEPAPRSPAAVSVAVADVARPSAPARAAPPPRFDATAGLAAAAAPAPRDVVARAPERARIERSTPEPRALPLALEAAEPPRADDDLPRRLEATPYRNRIGEERARALALHGGGAETEAAVAAGLAYLARIQDPRGSWGAPSDGNAKYGRVMVGKTGLCLLAFLGAGHWPGSGSEHAEVAARAVEFLLGVQDGASGHFGDTSAYSHGIATYALAECYAITREERLRAPLERAVAHVVAAQQRSPDPRLHGGWGYFGRASSGWNGDHWPRVSVTAWQVMALESARLGGLAVEPRVLADARAFLLRAWDEGRGAFRYDHDPDRLSSGYPILPASTPAAIFALSLLGVDAAAPELEAARAFVLERAPRGYRWRGDDAFVHRADANLYFWYYGTLAAFRAGGSTWDRWNAALKETLLEAQDPDGSWVPISIYAEYAGDDARDRAYTTAMCVLSLEVYYRYFTPLLEVR